MSQFTFFIFLTFAITASMAFFPDENSVNNLAKFSKASSIGIDLGQLISAVQKGVLGVKAALATSTNELTTLLDGRKELVKIEEVLQRSIILVEKEIIRLIVLAPFLNLEQLGGLLEETAISLINNANNTVLKVVEIASEVVFEFLIQLTAITQKLVENIRKALEPICKLLEPLMPTKKSSVSSLALTAPKNALDQLVSMIKIVVGLNIPEIMEQTPVTVRALGEAMVKAMAQLETVMSGSDAFEEIQATLDEAITKAESEIIEFFVIASFLNVQQLSTLLDETIISFVEIANSAAIKIQKVVSSLPVDSTKKAKEVSIKLGELIAIGKELNGSVKTALKPLLNLLKPFLPEQNVDAVITKISLDTLYFEKN